jgi:hypothetical protein
MVYFLKRDGDEVSEKINQNGIKLDSSSLIFYILFILFYRVSRKVTIIIIYIKSSRLSNNNYRHSNIFP